MQLSAAQFQQIKDLLPRQYGNVKVDHSQVLNAILFVATNDRHSVTWGLTVGQAGDAPGGRGLIQTLGPLPELVALLMDGAYEDDATR